MREAVSRERTFGLSLGAVCALVAAYFLWRGRTAPAGILGVLALGLILPALIRPSLLRIPSALWWKFVHALGWLNARIVLSGVFLLVFTPVGMILRLAGRDPLGRGTRGSGSGWVPYPERQRNPRHYERMY